MAQLANKYVPCKEYLLDVTATQFGCCTCGQLKIKHSPEALAGKPRQGPTRRAADPIPEKGTSTPPKNGEVSQQQTTPPYRSEPGNPIEQLDLSVPEPTTNLTLDQINKLRAASDELVTDISSCLTVCSNLMSKLDLGEGLGEIVSLFDKNITKKEMAAYFPVYGAMKAGKSTVLDCLIRSEVLPARSLPMTTIPIRILHTFGISEPFLRIPNAKKWNLYIQGIKESNTNLSEESHLDAIALLKKIRSGVKLMISEEPCITGKDIGDNLMLLSDVARLGLSMGLPLSEYDLDPVFEELPLITLTITIFKNLGSARPFYLIDTPGPDECRMSKSLWRINKYVLEQSSGALCVIPHDAVLANHTNEIMGPVIDSCKRMNKKLIIAINKIDSMPKPEEELPKTIDSLAQGMFGFQKFKIIGVSASRIKFAIELQNEVSRGLEGGELMKSKGWQSYFNARLQMTDDETCALQVAKSRIQQDIRDYGASPLVLAIKEIYLDSQRLALITRVGDISNIYSRLEEFVKQIKTCVDGEEQQLAKLEELRRESAKVATYKKTVADIRDDLKLSLPKIFDEVSVRFKAWANSQKWIIVDAETENPIDRANFLSRPSVLAWYHEECDRKMLPRVTKAYKDFVAEVKKNVAHKVESEWVKLRALKDTISGAIGNEASSLIIKFSQAPSPTFNDPDFTFKAENMKIPEHKQPDQSVTIMTKEFTETVLKYYVREADKYTSLVKQVFEDDLKDVFGKFEVAAAGFERQIAEMQALQRSLEDKKQKFERDLKGFMVDANVKFNKAGSTLHNLKVDLSIKS